MNVEENVIAGLLKDKSPSVEEILTPGMKAKLIRKNFLKCTQKQFARILCVGRTTIHSIEKSKTISGISTDVLFRLYWLCANIESNGAMTLPAYELKTIKDFKDEINREINLKITAID